MSIQDLEKLNCERVPGDSEKEVKGISLISSKSSSPLCPKDKRGFFCLVRCFAWFAFVREKVGTKTIPHVRVFFLALWTIPHVLGGFCLFV